MTMMNHAAAQSKHLARHDFVRMGLDESCGLLTLEGCRAVKAGGGAGWVQQRCATFDSVAGFHFRVAQFRWTMLSDRLECTHTHTHILYIYILYN